MTEPSVLHSVPSASQSLFGFAGRPKVLIGTGLAFIGCVAIGEAILLFSPTSIGPKTAVETPAAPGAITAPAGAAPQRPAVVADRWYEDATNAAAAKPVLGPAPSRDAWYLDHYTGQAAHGHVASNPRVADRWYEDATTSAASARPVVSAPPIRDAWYLDQSAAPTVPAPVANIRRVADRWWEDTETAAAVKSTLSAPLIRDAWYLDHSAAATAPALSQQARDTWYLDSANGGH